MNLKPCSCGKKLNTEENKQKYGEIQEEQEYVNE